MTDTTTTTETEKRGPGRPKGYPKSGGRAKGTPNRDRAATIDKIMREADPLLYLCKIARGDRLEAGDGPDAKKKTWWFPTGDQRISALQTLARKVLPDMKAVEVSGETAVQISTIERIIVRPEKPAEAAADSPVVSEPAPVAEPPAVPDSRPDPTPQPRSARDKMADKLDALDGQNSRGSLTSMEKAVQAQRRR